jgi:hypothetical protein
LKKLIRESAARIKALREAAGDPGDDDPGGEAPDEAPIEDPPRPGAVRSKRIRLEEMSKKRHAWSSLQVSPLLRLQVGSTAQGLGCF